MPHPGNTLIIASNQNLNKQNGVSRRVCLILFLIYYRENRLQKLLPSLAITVPWLFLLCLKKNELVIFPF